MSRMAFDHKRGSEPALQTSSTIAISMAAIDGALTELVARMEREIAGRGVLSPESVSEIRSLRIGAEQLLAAQTESLLVF
jgi:hypothetical protein